MNAAQQQTVIPDHVPAHLVRDIQLETLPGVGEDPHRAIAWLYHGPEIFYAPHGRQGGGTWMLTRAALIREVYQDAERFSSHHNADFSRLLGEDWPLIPLEIDPPNHTHWRQLLNPLFGPNRMATMEKVVRDLAVELIEKIRGRGGCEFTQDFGRPFPVTIFMQLMGLPLEETATFLAWEDGLLHSADMAVRARAAREIKDYLVRFMAERRRDPKDDITSFVMTTRFDGRPITDEEALGICYLFFVAGLDTVAASLGFIFRELAGDQALQARLRREPDTQRNAIEEIMRTHSIIVSGRTVTRDMDFHGVFFKKGDVVSLITALAGLDDREFPDPYRLDVDRQDVRHTAFSVGPHRCIGSHLARRELKIALEEWLTRVPAFRIAEGATITTHALGVWGVHNLPLVWNA
ncbi:MAG: cytochrome P450 [Gammaproteobacteria bacterium]